jgi:hypothetical protein
MKKQLLSESEIRKFMKFANIGGLASPFVERLSETYEMGLDEQEEEEEEDLEAATAPPAGAEEFGAEETLPDEEGLPDEEVLPDEEAPAGGDTDAALQGVMDAVEAMKLGFVEKGMPEVADAIGLSATGEEEMGGEDLGDEEELEMGGEAPGGEEGLEMDVGAEEEPDLGGEEEVEALDEAGIYLETTDNDVVQEVARRVAKRLLASRRRAYSKRSRRR